MRIIIWASLAIAVLLVSASAPPETPQVLPTGDAAEPAAASSPAAARASQPPEAALLPPETPPAGTEREFSTDFSRHTVPYREVFSGGPPKDGIPAIDAPRFIPVAEAGAWLRPQEPVVLAQVGDDARAYPLQILTWHEIVNDTVAGVPLTITFCPLCNPAIAFERMLDGRLDFGTTGRLRYSNLIMYDRQTATWWQQSDGQAIAGELAGRQLAFYPAAIIGWAEFRAAHPDGQVLSRETGYSRDYGRNPYVGYDDVNQPSFLFRGPATPGTLPPMARVLTVDLPTLAPPSGPGGSETVAYPYAVLETVRAVNDVVGGRSVAVFWTAGVASALDAGTTALGRDVGAAAAFSPELDGRRLTFRGEGERIVDVETGSAWDILGRTVAGELAGRQLTPVVSVNHLGVFKVG